MSVSPVPKRLTILPVWVTAAGLRQLHHDFVSHLQLVLASKSQVWTVNTVGIMVEQAPKGPAIILGRLAWTINNLFHDDRSIFPEDVPDLIKNQQSFNTCLWDFRGAALATRKPSP
jgi:hypothetical protein